MRRRALPAVVRWLFAADLVLVALYGADQIAGHPSWFLSRLVDLNVESNLPTWFSSLQLAGVSVLLFLAAALHPVGTTIRRAIGALALLLLFLSLDEIASIHEWLGVLSDRYFLGGGRETTAFSHTGLWMLALVPAVLLWLAWFVRPLWSGPLRSAAIRRLGAVGWLLLLGAAGGVELLSNFFTEESPVAILLVVLEEGGEMVGGTLLFWAAFLIRRGAAQDSPTNPPPV